MIICQFEYKTKKYWGSADENFVFPVNDFSDLASANTSLVFFEPIPKKDVKFLLPVSPSKIVCVGRNYAEHAAELGNEVPCEPLLFLKAPSALITNEEPIFIPPQTDQVEHEAELAVVIGRNCKNLSNRENASEYILGYSCINDVTARDLQRKDIQFTRAKSFDTFCPFGAFIETELDVSDIRVSAKVNGVIKQDGRTSQMVFPIDFLVKYISNQMTLNSGDIIATGTPSGVSKLNSGDICEVEIDGIEILRNPVFSATAEI